MKLLVFKMDYPCVSHNGQDCGVMMSTNPNIFHPIGIDKNHFRFMSGPEMHLKYYRGQNQFYEPCYTSKYRINSIEKKQIAEKKKEKFINLLKTHPIIKELETIQILDLSYSTDYEGLAQHYGFATEYIHITNDKDVAMFFACTSFSNGQYHIIKEDREVVLYIINMLHQDAQDRLNIVGAHAIPRPAEQKAFSINLKQKENLNNLSFVEYEKIICTHKISKYYFDLFDGGAKLFPQDIIEKKAQQINQNYDKKSYFAKRELSAIRKDWMKNKKSFYDKIALPRMSVDV